MTQAHEPAHERIKAAGLRLTSARMEILKTLTKQKGPVTIQAIASTTDVDQATVYRNIIALTKAGVLEEVRTAGHPPRFALTEHHHHDHIACTSCGTVVHVACSLQATTLPHHPQFAKIDHHEVTYYGLCKNCSSAR